MISTHSKVKLTLKQLTLESGIPPSKQLTLERGIPPSDFFEKAWASEPLTNSLKETNTTFALPRPDEDISLVAKDGDVVVGQCSANRVVNYWEHVKKVDDSKQNESTQVFLKIHKKAIVDEETHLGNQPKTNSFHSAGIATLPEYRGNKIGLWLRSEQIKVCKEQKATTLFCETTNRFSAATVAETGFSKVAVYPYKDLAVELNNPNLNLLKEDSFSVWCLKL